MEYANTVRDLFSLDEHFTRRIEKELPTDGKVGGFDRGALGLYMDEGQLTQYMTVAELVLDEGIFLEKPESQKFTFDARREKYPHGIGVVYRDETAKIIEDNPTPEFISVLKEPMSKIGIDSPGSDSKEYNYVPHGPFYWTVKNDGIEYFSGQPNYSPRFWNERLKLPFFPELHFPTSQ